MQHTQALEHPGHPSVEVTWPRRDVAKIVLLGEHDLASAATLERAIDETICKASALVIDLTMVEFIDSTVIATLVRTHRRARENRVGFCLVVGARSIARRALEVTSVLETLNAVESLEHVLRPAERGRDRPARLAPATVSRDGRAHT